MDDLGENPLFSETTMWVTELLCNGSSLFQVNWSESQILAGSGSTANLQLWTCQDSGIFGDIFWSRVSWEFQQWLLFRLDVRCYLFKDL